MSTSAIMPIIIFLAIIILGKLAIASEIVKDAESDCPKKRRRALLFGWFFFGNK